MKKVFIVGGGYDYAIMFDQLGYAPASSLEKADLVCFTGGADVSPGIYGDAAHPQTGNDPFRDQKEAHVFAECSFLGIPMVGICRGGQFLNVMSGGRMYQHVTAHCGNHTITDLRTGEELLVSSTHHQMIMPAPDALLVATAGILSIREWYDGVNHMKDVSDVGIEVVYYEEFKALCFQPHPEFKGYPEMRKYFGNLLNEFCNK